MVSKCAVKAFPRSSLLCELLFSPPNVACVDLYMSRDQNAVSGKSLVMYFLYHCHR